MSSKVRIGQLLVEMQERCPAGMAVGLHLRLTTPTYLFVTYPRTWVRFYSDRGLALQDPTVRWALSHRGHIRWSELYGDDDAGVLSHAKRFGLAHGVTLTCETFGSRSMAGFARSDRLFLDFEIDELSARFVELHRLTHGLEAGSEAEDRALKEMSVRLSR